MSSVGNGVSLEGKVAVVTGAGAGLGRAEALALARAGASVVVNDLVANDSVEDTLAQIRAVGPGATFVPGSVAERATADAMVQAAEEEFGGLDIVVNNAGITRDRMLPNMSDDEWDSVVAVHLRGHFLLTRNAAAYWRAKSKEAGGPVFGRVINTSSPSGVFGNVGQTNYGAAKAGIAAFTVIATQELARYGVTINCLAPNARTRMTGDIFASVPAPEGDYDPLSPDNISPIVVALASDDAASITGQVFFIYGPAINVLKPWDSGTLIKQEGKWDPTDLVGKLKESFPDGIAPQGMMPMVLKAAGER